MAKSFQLSASYSIGLLLSDNHEHHRQIALGAVEYHRSNAALRIVGERFSPLISWERLNEFTGDGLVAIVNSAAELAQLQSLGVPFVLAGARFLDSALSVVASDNEQIGRLAAKSLMSCGLKKFLFLGSRNWDDEQLRHEGFRAALQSAKFDCEVAVSEDIDFPDPDQDALSKAIITELSEVMQRTKPPIGVFCPNSFIGRATLLAAESIGLRVPDDVAVLAVNDDPMLCETSDPPLSTIVQCSHQIGFQAAQLLHSQLSGTQPIQQLFFPPWRVSVRRSSDVLLVGNEVVERAMRYMRDNTQFPIEIGDIADHVDVSRRTLELKFRETLESSPHRELLRMRLEMAKSLLIESKIPITEVALSSGFGSSQVFSSVFKKQMGCTPSQFRLECSFGKEVDD